MDVKGDVKGFRLLRQSRNLLLIAPVTAIVAILANALGVFNLLEWSLRDEFFRLRPAEAIEDKIVVATIDEPDIKAVGNWPIPDESLAKLLMAIREQKPRAIGLDLYRDLPEEPGHKQLLEVFRTTPMLVGVEKMTGNSVAPPPLLKELDQVGLADLVLDPDQKVRRGLLTAEDKKSPGTIKVGLATQVALKYLEAEKISLEAINADQQKYRLGKAIYSPMQNLDAGYSSATLGGYQILMNWRGATAAFPSVTMQDVLAGKIPAQTFSDRIVLIGSIAPSVNDFFETPYSSSWFTAKQQTPGVYVHANLASQLIRSAMDGRVSMRGFSGYEQWGWIVLWAIVGTGGSWRLAHTQGNRPQRFGGRILWLTVGVSSLLVVGAYGCFLQGLLIPVVPALAVLATSVIATTQAHKQQRLEQANVKLGLINQQLETANTQLEAANGQLRGYSQTLEVKTDELSESLNQLQQAQLQLVQSEKMSTLGQLVAGVAHEINNPVGFITNNLGCLKDYTQDLMEHLELYQRQYPQSNPEIEQHSEDIELEFLQEDMPKIITSMQTGVHRIKDISTSLRTFSRSDTQVKVSFNLQEGIDSTLLILGHRIKANEHRPAVQIIKEYGELPPIDCYPGQLNQVFMNILANAIDAMDEHTEELSFQEIQNNPHQITIRLGALSNSVTISIKDNGPGMPETVKAKIFEDLFTTKGVGKGTGLGLAIARQIVVERHEGTLEVNSAPGEGAEFLIQLPRLEPA
jgi:adenylate cyclase